MGARVSVELLLDNSAYARLASSAPGKRRAQEIPDAIEQSVVGVCLPFVLEAGIGA
jgi:hypothetical protein